MNIRRCLGLMILAVFFVVSAGPAEIAGPGESAALPPSPGPGEGPLVSFPLTLILEAAYGGAGRWRPDWPQEIPPDAFTVEGEASRIELEFDGPPPGIDNAPQGEPGPGGARYRLSRDSRGRATDFPVALPTGAFAQVRARYDEGGGILGFDLEVPAAAPAEPAVSEGTGAPGEPEAGAAPAEVFIPLAVQFPAPYLPGAGSPPAKEGVKVQGETGVYYVLFSEGGGEIAETWFDSWGNWAAYFTIHTAAAVPPAAAPDSASPAPPWAIRGLDRVEFSGDPQPRDGPLAEFCYESGGSLSACSWDGVSFSALYDGASRPCYWSRPPRSPPPGQDPAPAQYSLQWDQGGRLVRMRDIAGPGESPASAEESQPFPVDFRYEYEFDSRGNWIFRQEIALSRRGGLLTPVYGRGLIRRISYGEEG